MGHRDTTMKSYTCIFLITLGFLLGVLTKHVKANESTYWIYLYSHEFDEPRRVLEVTSDVDALGQCEFFRDLLDVGLRKTHPSAFFTCVTETDLVKGIGT